jgi:pimeloyl-ACP methyl ester carboxylesterase
MVEDRIHRAVADDGTAIAGRVHGQGPPLVLVHGGIGDGETSWRFLLPLLTARFTCFTPSLRGRGLSAEHPDQSTERLEQDVVTFVESIGEPVALFGHSSGGAFAIGAASRARQVRALAVYEPALPELASEQMLAHWIAAFARSQRLVRDGRIVDAAQVILEDVALANPDELATIAASGAAELLAPNVPIHLREVDRYPAYRVLPPHRLERLPERILLLIGARTHASYRGIVADLSGRLDATVGEVPGAGHLGPQIMAAAVATELAAFLEASGVDAPAMIG